MPSSYEERLPSTNAPLPSSSSAQIRQKPRTPTTTTMSTVLKRIALVGLFVTVIWWIYVWRSGVIEDFFDPNDKIHVSRPAFRYVEPYSSKHKYRPAASPILKVKGKDGKIKYKGKYT